MSQNTKIEWADHTFNPLEGCQKVGPGCDHCYAETRNARFAGGTAINWGLNAPRRRTSAANWNKPLAWNRAHAAFFAEHGRRQRVFCASLADVFDNAVDPAWRRDLFDVIELTPNLDWLLLTKRIGNVARMVADARAHDWLAGQRNVMLGATIVNQEEADRDIPKLLAVPARRRFLSMEPLLDAVNLRLQRPTTEDDRQDMDGYCSHITTAVGAGLHWIIVGGESGAGARPMNPTWARGMRDQCAAAGVPFLFKQWGEWLPAVPCRSLNGKTLVVKGEAPFTDAPQWQCFDDGQVVARVGKRAAGRQLDGVQHDGYPAR
ncbi:phage Gp37/Gp68 family protein [Massilia pseudoviolaceinigra]|uniref:phage Gp37/Gp68 family protein n=1 Tax=Massilia pseudoviolaceinigra TaxID=3057165 RepID=UPI0027965046|nr:phage Gp37/Gp68 family protein [Massilia sp. CCM 9206]MDQ1921698.1 phage Gp37/Gp68 family protein [Massilia sp. CCM 9206]